MKVRLLFFLFLLPSPLQAAEDPLQRGIDLLHQGKNQEALVIISEIAAARPGDGNVQITLGYALLRSGNLSRAEEVLQSALTTAGERGEIHRLLAEIAGARGDFAAAFHEIDQALTLLPRDRESLALKEKLTKEWQIEEKMNKNFGGNFTVTFEGGGEELGSSALATLEEAYVDLGSRFQLWPTEKIVVILYGQRDFKLLTNAPDWSGGLYDGKIRLPVKGVTSTSADWRRILYHEYAHHLVYSLARQHLPLWLNEGLAQWAAGEKSTPLDQARAAGKKLLPFADLEKTFATLKANDVPLAYAQSLSLTNYLLDYYGEARMIDFLRDLGRGTPFTDATEGILAPWNGDLNELVRAWQESLPSRGTSSAANSD